MYYCLCDFVVGWGFLAGYLGLEPNSVKPSKAYLAFFGLNIKGSFSLMSNAT